MNDQQAEEIIRQLKRINGSLITVGLILFGLAVGMVILFAQRAQGL